MGSLGIGFKVGEWGKTTSPYLKLIRTILETWHLVRKYTDICSFRKHTFYYQGSLNFADAGSFFEKKSAFFGKSSTFTQSNNVRVLL